MNATDPVRDEYARLARRYDTRWSNYISATTRETVRRMAPAATDRVLDVGCGTGVLLRVLTETVPGIRVTGIDVCKEMLAVARGRLAEAAELREGTADALPFPDGAFDVVVSISAFHYFRRPAEALSEMRRVLRPGGRLVVTDWCHDYFTCRVCDAVLRTVNRAHFRTYRSAECRAQIENAGFTGVSADRYKINWLWGLMTVRGTHPGA